jgi:endosialidase-like protein
MKTITECESKHRKAGLLFALVCAGVIATFVAGCAEAPTATARDSGYHYSTANLGNQSVRAYLEGHHGASGSMYMDTSSVRFKHDIKPMDKTSDAILALKPVTFHYKSDSTNTPQFGLIAEEVAKVNPDLIVRDEKGDIYTVRYEAVNAMLLNEFLKEHRTVQNQQKEIDALKVQLKEQAALIQRVSDKVEMSKPAPRTVLNNQ